ncbi:MAG: phosphoribosylformylglycinamidine cyclo-ligase [Bacteroidetes bacterium]|jgi:phosphoribosylformylglycinamidine cyclo-ligase|nr:phosphoribosylformylglycinamidine cyclo-ligase [Bacteroidota bacterium]
MSESKYAQRGVSAGKEEVHLAIRGLDKGLFPNAFCKILPDFAAGDPGFVNLMHADTAGTKTALAYLYWKETGDLSVWEGIVQDSLVMNLDDMAAAGMCNDFVVSSTIGRNKQLIDGQVLTALIQAQQSFAERMEALGIRIHLAGGETADVGDIVRTVDVGFTAFGRMPRHNVVDMRIQDGDVVIGLSSSGQASYEDRHNSGIGCNGLTFARHETLLKAYADKYPETYDPSLPEGVVYTGGLFLTDPWEGSPLNVGQMLLSPTRTYLPFIKTLLESLRPQIHGIVHCTGGGLTKVLHFIDDLTVYKGNPLPVPPVFQMIQQQTNTPWREMYQVFNMGQRLEVYLPKEYAHEVIAMGKSFSIDSQLIGVCKKGKKQVVIDSPQGEFVFGG